MSVIHRAYSVRCLFIVLVSLTLCLALAGCGGSSGSGGTFPYTGGYAGTFENSSGQHGTAYLKVDAIGNIVGTVINITTSNAAPLTGFISETGAAILTPAGNVASTGTLSLNSIGILDGTLADPSSNTVRLTLPNVNGGLAPVFAGALHGTYSASTGDVGNATFVIDANGRVTGLLVDTIHPTTRLISSTITNAGVMSDMLASDSASGTLLIGSGGQVTGTLTIRDIAGVALYTITVLLTKS